MAAVSMFVFNLAKVTGVRVPSEENKPGYGGGMAFAVNPVSCNFFWLSSDGRVRECYNNNQVYSEYKNNLLADMARVGPSPVPYNPNGTRVVPPGGPRGVSVDHTAELAAIKADTSEISGVKADVGGVQTSVTSLSTALTAVSDKLIELSAVVDGLKPFILPPSGVVHVSGAPGSTVSPNVALLRTDSVFAVNMRTILREFGYTYGYTYHPGLMSNGTIDPAYGEFNDIYGIRRPVYELNNPEEVADPIVPNNPNNVVRQGDNSLLTRVLDTNKGVDFMLARKIEKTVVPTSAGNLSAGEAWSSTAALERPILVGSFPWSTGVNVGKDLFVAVLPAAWANVRQGVFNSHVQSFLAPFAFYRFDLSLRVHVNSNHFYGGAILCAFDFAHRHVGANMFGSAVYSSPSVSSDMSLRTMSTMHSAMLDVSMSNELDFVIPYENVVPFMSASKDPFAFNTMGTFVIRVLHKLVKPDAFDNTVAVKVFCSASNVSLRMLRAPKAPHFEIQGVATEAVVQKTTGSFAIAGVDEAIHRLVLSDVVSSRVLGNQPSALAMAQKSGLLGVMSWMGVDTVGTVILSTHVLPVISALAPSGRTEYAALAAKRDWTTLACISHLFSFWRGDLVYRIKVGSSQFHTGRLVAVFHPFGSSVEDWRSSPHVFFDVRESHEFEFVVPFTSVGDWRPTGYNSVGHSVESLCTGVFEIIVVDPLISMSGSADSVSVSVWLSAGPTFEFAVPRAYSTAGGSTIVQGLEDGDEQSALLGVSVPRSVDTFSEDFDSLMSLCSRYHLLVDRFVTSVPSVIAQRPPTIYNHARFPVTPNGVGAPGAVGDYVVGPLSLLSNMFAFWKGSLKYKIVMNSVSRNLTVNVAVSHDPNGLVSRMKMFVDTTDPDTDGLALALNSVLRQNVSEISVPFYSPYDRLLCSDFEMFFGSGAPVRAQYNGTLDVVWVANIPMELSVYIAAGPDFEFSVPNGVRPFGSGSVGTSVRGYDKSTVTPGVVRQGDSTPVSVQGLLSYSGVDVNGINGLIKKASDVMPMLESTVFDSRVIMSKFVEMLPRLESILKVASTSSGFVESIFSMCSSLVSKVENTKNSVRDSILQFIAESPISLFESVFMVLVFGSVFFLLKQNSVGLGLLGALLASVVPLMLSEDVRKYVAYVGENFSKIFTSSCEDSEGVRTQGFLEEMQITPASLAHLLLAAVSVMLFGVVPQYKGIADKINTCGALGRNFSGIAAGVKTLLSAGEWLQNTVLDMLFEASPAGKEYMSALSLVLKFDVVQWLEDVNFYALDENRFVAFADPERVKKVRKLHDMSLKLIAQTANEHVHLGLVRQIHEGHKITKKLLDDLHQYKGLDVARVDPFHVSFLGDSGIGKSTMIAAFTKDLLTHFDEPEIDGVYARNVSSPYWDGYHGQTIVVYDDLAAVVHQSTPNDVSELIQVKSNAPCQVTMAGLNEKGLHFTSKYIVSTTNVGLVSADAKLRHAEAFHRRRNALVKVSRRVVDGVPLSFGQGRPELGLLSHLEFQFVDNLTTCPIGEPMEYDRFFFTLMDSIDVYMKTQKQILESYSAPGFAATFDRRVTQECVKSVVPVNEDLELLPAVVETQGERDESLLRVLVDQGVLTEDGEVVFQGDFLVLYNELSDENKSRVDVAVLSRYRLIVEAMDVETLVNDLPRETRVLIMQCQRACKFEGDKLIWTQELGEELYSELNEREKMVFRLIKKMNERLESERATLQVQKTKIQKIHSYVRDCWSSLSDKQKSVLRLAVGAGAFLAALGGIYKLVKPRDEPLIDNTIFNVGSNVVREGIVPSADEITRVGAKKKVNRTVMFEGLVPSADEVTRNAAKRKQVRVVYEGMIPSADEVTRAAKKKNVPRIVYEGESDISVASIVEPVERYLPKGTSFGNVHVKKVVKPVRESVVVEGADGSSASYSVESDVVKQASSDPDAQALIEGKLFPNIALVHTLPPEDSDVLTFIPQRMQCLFVTDSVILVPRHFTMVLKEGENFGVQILDVKVIVSFHAGDCVQINGRDLCVYRLGSRVSKVRNIVKFLASKDDWSRFVPTSANLVNTKFRENASFIRVRTIEEVRLLTEAETIKYDLDGVVHRCRGLRYRLDTVNGECGSPVVRNCAGSNGKIIGLHVAADTVTHIAYAELVVREAVEAALSMLDTVEDPLTEGLSVQSIVESGLLVESLVGTTVKAMPQGDIELIGTVPKNLQNITPTKTKISKTPLHGLIAKPVTEQAILSHKDVRLNGKRFDPTVNGINKYGEASKPFNKVDILAVERHLKDVISDFKSSRGVKAVLSEEEVINGCPGVEFMDRMNMDSSEGWPWQKSRPAGFSSKKWMFKVVGQYENGADKYEIAHEPLVEAYLNRISEAKCGRRVVSLSSECPKDERVKLKKIYDEPKTRVFTIMPVDYTMATRAFFLDFCTMIMSNRHRFAAKVGINPVSGEWSDLWFRLACCSDIGFAGDFQAFDGKTCPDIVAAFGRIVNHWYDDGKDNARARMVLLNEVSNRFTLCGNTVMKIGCGIPSGVSITVILNCFVNLFYLMMAWRALARESGNASLRPLSHFEENVEPAVYGDDNIVAVKAHIVQWYNLSTVSAWLLKYGIVYTDNLKRSASEAEPFVKLDTLTFLKRGFVSHWEFPMWRLAPLDKDSIEERCMWTRAGGDDDEILYQNIESSLFDALMHGRVYFTDFKKRVNDALKHVGKRSVRWSFEDMEMRWFATIPGLEFLAN